MPDEEVDQHCGAIDFELLVKHCGLDFFNSHEVEFFDLVIPRTWNDVFRQFEVLDILDFGNNNAAFPAATFSQYHHVGKRTNGTSMITNELFC